MKKYLLVFCALFTLIFCTYGGFSAHAEKDIDIILNGQTIACDSPPLIQNNRTIVPIYSIVTPLGGNAVFDGAMGRVTVTVDGKNIVFTIGSASASVDGITKQLDAPASIINDRTMIPVRFLAEELGYRVQWDGASRAVLIDTPSTIKQITDVWVK